MSKCNVLDFTRYYWRHIPDLDLHLGKLFNVNTTIESLSRTYIRRLRLVVSNNNLLYSWSKTRCLIVLDWSRIDLTPFCLALVMFILSVTICEIFAIETCQTLSVAFRMDQVPLKIFQIKVITRLNYYLIAIVIFSQSLTVCQIHKSTSQMFPIRIFDLQEEGQSHEVQRRKMRH